MIPGSANPLLLKSAAAAGGLQIQRSIRLNSADSAYFSRTPGTAGNRRTWTWSGWVKRSTLGTIQQFFTCSASGYSSNWSILQFNSSDKLGVFFGIGSNPDLLTTAVYRDPSAWMHVLINCDTTQATAANRGAIYVNGVKITAFDFETYRTQNFDTDFNTTSAHDLGRQSTGGYYIDGYLANIHFIDGQALTPSSFTETDATTGQLIPKTYTGSYGTTGFNLLFADNSSNTASTLGKDTSGLGNNFTPNNLSVTAGAGNDSLVDSPTNYGTDTGVGGEVRGNYCTLNPLQKNTSLTISNGNLDAVGTGSNQATYGTIGVSSGKWYWEVLANGGMDIGIANASGITLTTYVGSTASSYAYDANGNKYNNGSGSAYGASFTTNDVIGVAFDADNGTLTFYKNGTSQGQAFSSLTSGPYFPAFSTATASYSANFGQRAFAYTAPSGYKALCTQNLPAPLVTKSNTVMDVVTYSGNGGTTSLTTSFSPDMVWIKCRSANNYYHRIFDQIRGAQTEIYTNATDAEATASGGSNSFTSTGFNVASDYANTNSQTFVAWMWDAGTSTVSNTQGSITSQVRANATAGFSVVGYTGTSSNATVGHGLGVTPGLLICKSRTQSGGSNWVVWHSSFTGLEFLRLNTTDSKQSASVVFNSTAPNSTVISLGSDAAVNGSGNTHIIYAFAPVVGSSSFGSYVGNGSADGPFVYTGFRPRWVLFKRSDTSSAYSDWYIIDSARNIYNLGTNFLRANSADPENYYNFSTGNAGTFPIDFLSNGFKYRLDNSGADVNANGGTYIYAAFAEMPFNYSRAR
jgi:hypothetical protein